MSKPVPITRLDRSAIDLRREASRCRDGAVVRRLLAIALVLEGRPRTEAAEACGMDRQTLRDWVHHYNADGIDGLFNRHSPGRPAQLTAEQLAAFKTLVEQGPDLARDGVVRWRCSDLQARLQSDFDVQYHERSVGKLLAKLAFRKLTARPFHPEQDTAAQETHKKNFAALIAAALPPHAAGKPLEIWWQDEARVGQQGTLTRVWAKRGSRPAAPRDRRYTWAYVFGAVCPARGVGAGIVMPSVNLEAMSEHLREVSRNVAPGAHCLMQVDGAGWHRQSERLIVPANITLLTLPPYSPELNPVENIWQYLRSNWLSHRLWESYEEIVDACCAAWNTLMAMPDRIASIAHETGHRSAFRAVDISRYPTTVKDSLAA